ncbi:MAG: nucleotidyltransferase domain-containing protein [Candidatus Brockarchaeota archaeon]|nr:nucleotidyltransferase domain-containing protein [Candidatus Brockarchaeota archaeon]
MTPYRTRQLFLNDVVFAYIFGSRSRNPVREYSDYDIAVFFRNNNVSLLDEITLGARYR